MAGHVRGHRGHDVDAPAGAVQSVGHVGHDRRHPVAAGAAGGEEIDVGAEHGGAGHGRPQVDGHGPAAGAQVDGPPAGGQDGRGPAGEGLGVGSGDVDTGGQVQGVTGEVDPADDPGEGLAPVRRSSQAASVAGSGAAARSSTASSAAATQPAAANRSVVAASRGSVGVTVGQSAPCPGASGGARRRGARGRPSCPIG